MRLTTPTDPLRDLRESLRHTTLARLYFEGLLDPQALAHDLLAERQTIHQAVARINKLLLDKEIALEKIEELTLSERHLREKIRTLEARTDDGREPDQLLFQIETPDYLIEALYWEVKIFPTLPDGSTICVVHWKTRLIFTHHATKDQFFLTITKAGSVYDSRDPGSQPRNWLSQELSRLLGPDQAGMILSKLPTQPASKAQPQPRRKPEGAIDGLVAMLVTQGHSPEAARAMLGLVPAPVPAPVQETH